MAIETLTGNDGLLYVDVSAAGDGSDYQLVGYQRGLTHEQTREIIDASHKGSDFAQSVYGRQSGTLTMDGLRPDPDFGGSEATHQALYDAQDNKQPVLLRIRERAASGVTANDLWREAEALVGTITVEYPDNDVATFSVELTFTARMEVVTVP